MFYFFLYCLIIILIILYVFIPGFLFIFPSFFARFIFLNHFFCPFYTDLSKPERFKFNKGNWRNFKIISEDSKSKIGGWQIINDVDNPEESRDVESFSKIFSNGNPIMVYYHGNSMNRGSKHRVELYHLFRNCGFHVFTIDYRGFGDSSGSIHNEEQITEDALTAFKYVRKIAPESCLFLWGHSLGTGIVSSLLIKLSKEEIKSSIGGVFLEAPFTSVVDTLDHIFHAMPWRFMPYFNRIFKQSLINENLSFNSIENLKGINIPIMILHAEDDIILSYDMGLKLYYTLKENGDNVFFKGFSSKCGYGHKWIVHYPALPSLIRDFTEKAILLKNQGFPIRMDFEN